MTKERAAKIILDMINGAESPFGHSLSATEINALKKAYCALNTEPTTNADRIRAMTNEELVKQFAVEMGFCCPVKGVDCSLEPDCRVCFARWLKQEATDG